MSRIRTIVGSILVLVISCLIMYGIDVYSGLNYFYKSIIKIGCFLVIPLIYSYINKDIDLKSLFKLNNKNQMKYSLLLGVVVYILIIITYIIFINFIDLSDIKNILGEDLRVGGNNFIYVSIYISFINSLLEEFFFRGFAFFTLKKNVSIKFAYVVSAILFAFYHIGIILEWFNIYLFILVLIGLVIAGIIFNYINDKYHNIYNSWLVHMFANFAINSIGIYMFYFI